MCLRPGGLDVVQFGVWRFALRRFLFIGIGTLLAVAAVLFAAGAFLVETG